MSSVFIGVYKALYDYQALNTEELSISENDLLYLLERSEMDDWWKVKKRILDADVEEPIGLVPSTYISPATPIRKVKALYDYDKQTDEELSFTEGQIFDLFDDSDENWLLVGLNDQQFGFIPSNYVETAAATPAVQPVVSSTYGSSSALNSFPPPPQRKDLASSSASPDVVPAPSQSYSNDLDDEPPLPKTPTRPVASNSYSHHDDYDNYSQEEEDGGEAPPPMPTRPGSSPQKRASSSRSRNNSSPPPLSSKDKDVDFYHDDLFTWPVYEIDGRKKRKTSLAIGNSTIFIKSSESGDSKDWSIRDLMNYNSEKKHVFLEFKNPYASYEFHAGSKDAAEAIISILGDLKGMNSMSALKEVEVASQPTGGANSKDKKQQGKILYDFEAASSDELTVYENDIVIILNDKKSKEWWMVQNTSNGKVGVIPSNYIKVISSSSSGGFKSFFTRKSSTSSLNLSSPSKKQAKKDKALENQQRELQRQHDELERQKRKVSKKERELRDREERDKIRKADERERLRREKEYIAKQKSSSSSSGNNNQQSSSDPAKPNPHRVRTWIDRSGSFKVEAEFLGCSDGKIHLHKVNGVKIAVAAVKLSLEDLEYVERITGMSLENYKPKEKHEQRSTTPVQPQRPSGITTVDTSKNSSSSSNNDVPYNSKLHEYWFDFFVSCGVDANVCERYAKNFTKEEMDQSILEDIPVSLLRTLGLREGDILRVNKFLDIKFNRLRPDATGALTATATGAATNGGLFSGSDGTLKNNKTGSQPQFEDDAWVVKPANATTQTSTPSAVVPQVTGSIQDLVNIKPAESKPFSTGGSSSLLKPVTTSSTAKSFDSIPSMTPQKTASTMSTQQTGALFPMPTGFMPISMVPALTGAITGGMRFNSNLMPFQTGGNMAPALTGGLMALQRTGGLQPMPQTSFGMGMGLPAALTGGLMPLQKTGGLQPMPATSFGGLNTGLNPALTGGLVPLQKTGGFQPMAMPQTSFGLPPALTGGLQQMPTTSFGMGQPTGGYGMPAMTGGLMNLQKTGGYQPMQLPQTSFGVPAMQPNLSMPQTSFNANGNMMPQVTNMMSNMNLSQQQPMQTGFNNGFQQQQPMQTGFNTGFQSQQPIQTGLNNGFQQQPMQTGFNGFQQPMQQQQQQQPLMSQPTGLGFGNAPSTSFGFGNGGLVGQPTGKRANLANATADNPFGF